MLTSDRKVAGDSEAPRSFSTNQRVGPTKVLCSNNNTSASVASVGMLVSLVGVGILGIGGTDRDRTSNCADQRGNLSCYEENGLIKNYLTTSIVKEL